MRSCTSCRLTSGAIALAAWLALPSAAAGLEGKVTYRTSAIPSAIVSVYQESSGRKAVTLSNSSGEYRFDNLPSGSYIVLVEKDGRRIYQGRTSVAGGLARFDIPL